MSKSSEGGSVTAFTRMRIVRCSRRRTIMWQSESVFRGNGGTGTIALESVGRVFRRCRSLMWDVGVLIWSEIDQQPACNTTKTGA